MNKHSIITYHRAALDGIYSDSALKGNNTFRAWHGRAREAAKAVKDAKAAHDREIEGMRDVWADRVIEEKRAKYAADYMQMVEEAKEAILNDLDHVAEAKRAQLSKSLGAPSQDMVNLLAVLNMRSHLEQAEIAAIVPQLSGNLQALRVLSEIADRSNIYFPSLPSVRELDDATGKIREFAERMVDSLDAPEWNYNQTLFWTKDFAGLIQREMDMLDSPAFLQVDTAQISTKKNDAPKEEKDKDSGGTIEPGKKPNAVKVYLRGDESIGRISVQFGLDSSEIRAANPGYDWSNIHHGDAVIIPAGKLRVSNAAGSVVEGQCVPTYYEKPVPGPKDGDNIALV